MRLLGLVLHVLAAEFRSVFILIVQISRLLRPDTGRRVLVLHVFRVGLTRGVVQVSRRAADDLPGVHFGPSLRVLSDHGISVAEFLFHLFAVL